MTEFELLMERNRDFAAQQASAGALMPWLPDALPNVKAIIIGCADMRVDPAHVLGIKPGEAVIMRNIGGRVTPGLLEQLGLLGQIGAATGRSPGGGGEFHLVVMQHTDCGITRLGSDPSLLMPYFQVSREGLKEKLVSDPRGAVRADVATLRGVDALPGDWLVSGLVYDVNTGLIEVVESPVPTRQSVPVNSAVAA